MAIPSKQIGWSQESNLLWEISKQMERLTKVVSTSGGGGNSECGICTPCYLEVITDGSEGTPIELKYFNYWLNSTPFTSVLCIPSTGAFIYRLYGGSNFTLTPINAGGLDSTKILSINDGCGIVTGISGGIDNTPVWTKLTYVNLPNVVSIPDYTFTGCNYLGYVNLPKATSIGDFGFYVCVSLINVSLPLVTSVGVQAFDGCGSLQTINLPLCTQLGPDCTVNDFVFSSDNSVTTLTVPAINATCNAGGVNANILDLLTWSPGATINYV